MSDNSKILEDISTLTQICRSNSDGPTLKIEETEIKNKLVEYDEEIEEIKAIDADDSYDTSAEMADRNIEIITKKVIQSTNNELKNKNSEMDSLKEKEAEYSNSLHGLKRTRISYEKYIASLKDRLTSSTDESVTDRYNNIIANTETKMIKQDERIKEMEEKHAEIQNEMDALHQEIIALENRLETKKTLLAEAQNNLQNKDLYIDKAKKEKSTKRIREIEEKKEDLNKRLDEISKDPKYLEMKIKEILTEGSDNFEARNYIIELLTTASKIPYADQYVDKRMEEELLDATQKRDTFAAEIDNKTYDIMDSTSPEQIRVEFLNNRISYWQSEIKKLEEKVAKIDKDETFHYAEKTSELDELISKLKEETQEFKTRYEKESDSNLSNKAILKLTYEEKRADLAAAEEISSKFRKNEAEDVEEAGRIVKQDIEELNRKVSEAEEEIYQIKERLDNRKSGNKDLSAKNKDREKLEELAQVVIDIKHRRQFADRTYDIAKRLEFNLGMKLVDAVYSEEEQEKLSKEVMIPIEEPVAAQPEVVEVQTPPSEEEPTQVTEEVTEAPVEETTVTTEVPTVPIETTATTTEVPPVSVETTEIPNQESQAVEAPTEETQTTEETTETPVVEESVADINTTEIPVAEPSQDITVEEAINEIPPEITVTEDEKVEEPPIASPAEAVAEPSLEVELPEDTNVAEVPEVSEEVVDNIVSTIEDQETIPEVVVPSIETPTIEETTTTPTPEENTNLDVNIPSIEPTSEEVSTEDINNGQLEVYIPDEAPQLDTSTEQAQEVIPEMPPLPELPNDDTSSIPVIPIAEPSTDDNFTFASEENDNNESETTPIPESVNTTELPIIGETE